MIYVYRRKPSKGAERLARALGGMKIGYHDLWRFRSSNDHLICWGESVAVQPNVLNRAPLRNKYQDAIKLAEAGVPTIEVSLEPPSWIGRSFYHHGGSDLLRVNFYVKRENLVKEYRLHSFRGKSIRAGIKRSVGEESHSWIRSLQSGWKIFYDGVSVRQRHRDLAHQAISALGLDFGAVDLGEREDGSLIVLEVNRAPGLDGGTIDAYAQAVRRWIDESQRVEG
jgi:hypothetical protein